MLFFSRLACLLLSLECISVHGKLKYGRRYLSETENSACYGEFPEVVTDEGNQLGAPVINVQSEVTCRDACDGNDLCKSFSYCPQWASCFLKDRILSGSEPTTSNGACKTHYRTTCPNAPRPAQGPSPAPSPPPALLSETRASACYRELPEVVTGEGNQLGAPVIDVQSEVTCSEACDGNDLCKSFSYCPQWTSCFLKDRILNGSEPTTPNGACKTYYQTSCPSPSLTQGHTQGPSPGPSPSPAPSSDRYPLGTPVFIQSHRNEHLKDHEGQVQLTTTASAWEKWMLSDAGNGKVFITSHRNEHLQDNGGRVELSGNSQDWEQWTITAIADGKVALRSYRGEYLQDSNGQLKMSGNLGAWEAWSIILAPEPTRSPDAFTIVVIPDVQFMTVADNDWVRQYPRLAWPEKWYVQANWVAGSKDRLNIKAVVQVGDLVETGCNEAHWSVFRAGWEQIHATGLPYSFAPGNHDCDNPYDCLPYGWSCYNRQVPYFLDRVSFPVDFKSPGHYENMITLFEADGLEFIIVGVEWNTPADTLAWARQKLEQHSDRWAIFNMHYAANSPGFLDLAMSHPKTFMVTQGHACIGGEESHTFHQGAGKQPFIEILVDYQCNNNGFLKHFSIDRAVGQVRSYSYNPFTQESRTGPKYEYSWDFAF